MKIKTASENVLISISLSFLLNLFCKQLKLLALWEETEDFKYEALHLEARHS